jgi:hypothetical protein
VKLREISCTGIRVPQARNGNVGMKGPLVARETGCMTFGFERAIKFP